MANVVELTERNFDEVVTKSDKPVLVDFSAEWCAPCWKLTPIIEEIANEYHEKAIVCHLDVDNAQGLAQKYQILSVPTCLFFKGGEPKDMVVGLVPKEVITEKIDSLS